MPEHSVELDPSRGPTPRWVWKATAIFWGGALAALLLRSVWASLHTFVLLMLVSLFLSLAIEPATNRLARRGWRRGVATFTILVVVVVVIFVFVIAIAALVGQQVADLLVHSERYVTKTVNFINDTFGAHLRPDKILATINDPNGKVQHFIKNQQGKVVELSVTALTVLVETFSVMLFTFYLVADGPKLRRAICSRLRPERQRTVLATWELAIEKTGGYLYSRVLLGGISAVVHWIGFAIIGVRAPLALALWVGVVSQFMPVIGTYVAGALPVLVAFLDSPGKALVALIFITVYVQVQDYVFLPRISRRTMQLHPAIAFGSAIAGAAILGVVGALLAIPAAAMVQALISGSGRRHEVVESHLTTVHVHGRRRLRRDARAMHPTARPLPEEEPDADE